MTDQPKNEPRPEGPPEPVAPSAAAAAAPPPPPPPPPEGSAIDAITVAVDERPELAAGAAFAGGFVLAMILKRLAG